MALPSLEVSTALEVGPLVKKYGVAIWRNLVPAPVIQAILDIVVANVSRPEAYRVIKGGVMSSAVLPAQLRLARIVDGMGQAFGSIVAGHVTVHDDADSGSGIYMAGPSFQRANHPWHQDSNNGKFPYAACVWVACTNAGETAPGISFVLGNPGADVIDLAAEVQRGSIFTPTLFPGDAVFFDTHSIHATHKTPEMTQDRVAFKLMATLQVS